MITDADVLDVVDGSGATVTQAIPGIFYKDSDIKVYRISASDGDNTESLLVQGQDYTIAKTKVNGVRPVHYTGSITTSGIVSADEKIAVMVWPENQQQTDFSAIPHDPANFELQHDLSALRDQSLLEVLKRSVRLPLSVNGPQPILPSGGKYLRMSDDGRSIVGVDQNVEVSGKGANFDLRNASSAAIAKLLPDGTLVSLGGYLMLRDDTKTGVNSVTADLGVDGFAPAIQGFGYRAGAFGVVDAADGQDTYDCFKRLWDACLADGVNLDFIGAGTVDIGDNNAPCTQTGVLPTPLLDCGGIAIIADPSVTFKTTSADGADVFQLNGLDNFSIVGFPKITATLTDTIGAGSNGVSITAGWDRLYLEVDCVDLPRIDEGSYMDGGKGVTFQPSTTTNPCGTAVVKMKAKGCAYAFGCDMILTTVEDKAQAIDVELFAEDCHGAVVISAAAASAAISTATSMGVRVRGAAVNCQRDVLLSRAHDVDVDLQVNTSKTIAARRLAPDGSTWWATQTEVTALEATYAHDCQVNIRGNKGDCDHKARIGGATAGSSGLIGATNNSVFVLDVAGAPVGDAIEDVNSGGNVIRNSNVYVSQRTASEVPATFLDPTKRVQVQVNTELRLATIDLRGNLNFAYSDNDNAYNSMFRSGTAIGVKQTQSSTPTAKVLEVQNNSGTSRGGFLNNGGIMTDARATNPSALSTKIQDLLIYDGTGALVGKVPVYSS